MGTSNKGTRVLFFFAGASPDYLRQLTPSDRLKIKLLGTTPFVPAIVGYFGGGFGISTYYNGPWFVTWLVLAPLCALMLLFLEVIMTATLSPGTVSFKKCMIAIPRIMFSLLISFSLALPPKVAIFSGPIQEQLDLHRQDKIDDLKNETSPRIRDDQKVLDTAIVKYDKKEAQCDDLQSSLLSEVDGINGSKIRGFGTSALLKEEAYNACMLALGTYKSELQLAEQRLEASKFIQRQDVAPLISNIKEQTKADLMEQYAAWKAVSSKNSTLAFFGWVIFFLFVFMDFLPTLTKIMTDVPSYVFAERAENRKKLVNLHAHLDAFKRTTHERSRALTDAAIKKREVRMYHTMLSTKLRKLDIAYQIRKQLENRSNIQHIAEQLDLDPFRQTIDDITDFQDLSQPLDESDSEDTSSTNNAPTTNPDNPPPHDTFVLKRIV